MHTEPVEWHGHPSFPFCITMMKSLIPRAKRRLSHLLRRSFPRAAAILEFPDSRTPRYGWGRPQYSRFYRSCEEKRLGFASLLSSFLQFSDKLLGIPRCSNNDVVTPAWDNEMFLALDAVALYCMLSLKRPAQYVEIGAGNSTRFARRAISDNTLWTCTTCIDPAPGLTVEAVADRIITSSLEDTDLELFKKLNTGDVLFIDGSHRALMHS